MAKRTVKRKKKTEVIEGAELDSGMQLADVDLGELSLTDFLAQREMEREKRMAQDGYQMPAEISSATDKVTNRKRKVSRKK